MKKVNDKFNNRNVFKLYPHNWKRPSNWWDNIKDFFRGFKYTYQRATKGYCDYDLFSISDWFLEMFPNMLKESFQMGLIVILGIWKKRNGENISSK